MQTPLARQRGFSFWVGLRTTFRAYPHRSEPHFSASWVGFGEVHSAKTWTKFPVDEGRLARLA
jgi:hypothetical protein